MSNDETTTATMPSLDKRAAYVNAAIRRDRQMAEVASARNALRQEEQRLAILEEAEAEFYAAMVNATPGSS